MKNQPARRVPITWAIIFASILLHGPMALPAAGPEIVYQPRDQRVLLHQPAGFGVIAASRGALSYQWRKDGIPILGATNDQIVFAHAQFADAGGYSVVVDRRGIARLNLDGSLDLDFLSGMSGVDGSVHALALEPDGKVLVGGEFSRLNGEVRNGIARLNPDGSLDTAFQSGMSGVTGDHQGYKLVDTIAVQEDGKILIGGRFETVNGAKRTHLARLNSDGSLDFEFHPVHITKPGHASPLNSSVFSIVVREDRHIVIGGSFGLINGVGRTHVARLLPNGALDRSFSAEPVFAAPGGARPRPASERITLNFVGLENGGKVIIGGHSHVEVGSGGTRPETLLLRLNPDGSLDESFSVPEPISEGAEVSALAMHPDRKIVVVGHSPRGERYPVRFHADGSLDTTFRGAAAGPQSGAYYWSGAHVRGVLPDGQVVVQGRFYVTAIERLTADGTFQTGFPLLDSWMLVALQPEGKMLVARGYHATSEEYNGGRLFRLNRDGTLDSTFVDGLSLDSVENTFSAIEVQPDGKILAGGWISTDGITRRNLVRLNPDGSLDETFSAELDDMVKAIALDSSGNVLVGGSFRKVNGIDQIALVRLRSDGTMDAGFQAVLTGTGDIVPCWGASEATVDSLAIQEDGKILIAGYFSNVNGVRRHQFARLNSDGSVDGGFQCELSWHDGCERYRVLSIVPQPDGRILIGGRFAGVSGVDRPGLARLNSDGSLDGSFRAVAYGPFRAQGFVPMEVTSLMLQEDGKLLIGGHLGMINDVPVNGIARLWGDPVMPALEINLGSDDAAVSWPPSSEVIQLQSAAALNPDPKWIPVAVPAEMHGGRMTVTIPVDSDRRFFRLIGEN